MLRKRVRAMSDISVNKNECTFTWLIEEFDYYNTISSFDNHEMRSPLFTTDHLGQSSWFLTIRRSYDSQTGAYIYECSLVRYSDEGPDMIQIQWQLEVTSTNKCISENVKDDSTIHGFTKGYSCKGCKFKSASKQEKLLTLQCQMTEYSSVEKPVSTSSTVRTKISIFLWKVQNLLEMKLFSGAQNIQYEVFFHVNKGYISLRIRRSDRNNLIKFCMFCGFYMNENRFYTNEIDQLLKPFNVGDIIDIPTSLTPTSLTPTYSFNGAVIKGSICTSIVVDDHRSKCEKKHKPFAKMNPALNLDITDISSAILRMYENGIHSDVKLLIGSESLPAHKCLLSARSPVFSAMFDQDMAENQTGIVNITDMDANILKLFLRYMYTDIIGEFNFESAIKVLMAAEKYQVLSLKEKCANYLLDVLSVENVCEVLVVADMISYSELKMSAFNYVKWHANKVLLSESWKQLVKKNVTLVAETLSLISEEFGTALIKESG